MPIIQATGNLKIEKPEADHALWERAYWRFATLMDLWLTQVAKGHYVVSGGNLTLNGTSVDLDATTVQFAGTAAPFAVGPATPIAPLVSGNTYVVYVDAAGAVQVSTLTAALLWAGPLPNDFVLLGVVFELEGVWAIHNLPLTTSRGKLGGVAGLNGAGAVVQEPASKGQPNGLASLNGAGAVVQEPASKGQPNGLASLNGAGAVVQEPASKAQPNGLASLNGAGAVVQLPAGRGQASGVASLDATTKVPIAEVPDLDAGKITTGRFPQARIGAAAIGQAELKTSSSTHTFSGSVNNDGLPVVNTVTLAGGEYSLFPRIRKSAGGAGTSVGWSAGQSNVTSSAFESLVQVSRVNTGGSTTTVGVEINYRYVTASPPYDLGDGDVPLFLFVWIKGGKVYGTWSACDPPWAYNGPTDIRPTHKRGSQLFRTERRLPPKPADPIQLAQWAQDCAAWDDHPIELVEITQSMKQADMPLIPHPFLRNEFTAEDRVVLIDPCSPILKQCARLWERGVNLSELLHSGALYVDPESKSLDRAGPPGVDVVSVAWRDAIL